jgi:hypothetical protein
MMAAMQLCPSCRRSQPEIHRFCTQCGQRLDTQGSAQHRTPAPPSTPEQLSLNVLYGMVAALIVAVLFPPWETPPSQPPEFLGIHFFLSPPAPDAIVSRMLLTIELTTITIGGLYAAFFFRKR